MPRLDPLTGLKDRIQFLQDLASGLDTQWILRVDLDSLIFLVDNSGHLVGDEAINRTANGLMTLSQELGGEAYRVGGDDFIVTFESMVARCILDHLPALQAGLKLSEFSFGNHPFRPADSLSASFLLIPSSRISTASEDAPLAKIDKLFYAERNSSNGLGRQMKRQRADLRRGFIAESAAFDA